jgi:predicted nucleic acid-binding protein
MKKKYKVYLDTNAFSGLLNIDAPGNKETIEKIFEAAKKGQIELCFSDVLLNELESTNDKIKRDFFIKKFFDTKHIKIITNDKAINIARTIINLLILPQKSETDALHIGLAISHHCDFIIS